MAISLTSKQVYTARTQGAAALNDNPPMITGFTTYQGQANRTLIESGSQVEIHGDNLISVDGRPTAPLASGQGYALGS